MLVLERKIGESIIIDKNIKVVIMRVKTHSNNTTRVVLGIEAPKSVIVDREEVHINKITHPR